MIVPARDAMGTAARPAPPERVAGNVSWGGKAQRASARASGRSIMRKLASGLVLTFAVVGSGTSAQAGPWCAFYDFIDIQLRLPQLRAVLRHDLWERRMVPTKLFRAIRPGSPIGQDASAFPLLTHCGDATWLRQFAIASQIAKSGHPRRVMRPAMTRPIGRTPVRTLPSHALRAGLGIGQQPENGGDDDGGN